MQSRSTISIHSSPGSLGQRGHAGLQSRAGDDRRRELFFFWAANRPAAHFCVVAKRRRRLIENKSTRAAAERTDNFEQLLFRPAEVGDNRRRSPRMRGG